jgi:tetratricopeptide (TPR) repeat protein
VAYLNLGQYEQAISDLEKTAGRGELDLGTIEALIQRAKAAQEVPAPVPQAPVPVPQPPVPQPQPPVPVPVPVPTPVPQPPSIDPALQARAQTAMNQARRSIDEARDRGASATAEYRRAVQQYTDANNRLATARSNADLNAVIAAADNVALLADSARGSDKGESLVLADTRRRVQSALASYFNGEFGEASRAFENLSRELPQNAWIWAFLGASQYSQYAFEADDDYRKAALESFRKAKSLRSWKNGLPEKYFSRRIRRAFETSG